MRTFCINFWYCQILGSLSKYRPWRLPRMPRFFHFPSNVLGLILNYPVMSLFRFCVRTMFTVVKWSLVSWKRYTEVYVRDFDWIKIKIFHVWDIRAAWENVLQTSSNLVEEIDSKLRISVKFYDEFYFIHIYFFNEVGELVKDNQK